MTYKLVYFDLQGKGEPIRLMLSYMGKEFEDVRLKIDEWSPIRSDEWSTMKSKAPYGKVPFLEVDGQQLHQSIAITRYLGKQANLAGKNDWEDLQIDMVAETIDDVIHACADYHYEANAEIKAKKKEKLHGETGPFYLSRLDELANKNNGYLANGALSWADIYFFGISNAILLMMGLENFDKYPNLKHLRENVLAIPRIKKWVDSRPTTRY